MRRRILIGLLVLATAGAAVAWWNRTTLKRLSYEEPDRDTWQQPEQVLRELSIAPGQKIADIGSGGGYFTFRFAAAVGTEGAVYAVDVDPDMTKYVAEQASARGLSNIETVVAATDDPQIPEPVDLMFTSNTYHHLQKRTDYFRRAQRYLRPGGRVAIIEYSGANNWFARTFGHSTGAAVIRAEMEAAGFRLEKQHDFLPQQHFLVFVPANREESKD